MVNVIMFSLGVDGAAMKMPYILATLRECVITLKLYLCLRPILFRSVEG